MRPLNLQSPEKIETRGDGALNVHSVWPTIQGEGPFAGQSATFVRLSYCNLQCPLCDTDYTPQHKNYLMSPEKLLGMVKYHRDEVPKSDLVVITGGEPFRQNFGPFARLIRQLDIRVQIETNGTLFQEDVPVLGIHIVCSPKTPRLNEDLKPYIKTLKYVVRAGEVDVDGLPTRVLGMSSAPARPWASFRGEVYVQPCDELDPVQNAENLRAAVESCMKHGYRLGCQLHKVVGVP